LRPTWLAELSALASTIAALPYRSFLASAPFDDTAEHPRPVMLVHGFCGDRTNFLPLRDVLVSRGMRNFAAFSYGPSINYQRLAPALGDAIERTCAESGFARIDVVGHSLGGLLARYLVESGAGKRIRRLVSLGSPHYLDRFPACELAIFGEGDWVVPIPRTDVARTHRVAIVPGCSHLSLLYHPVVLARVADFLTSKPRVVSLATRRAA
jgi:pimeloyl-ACP methyl ester carboxylesterase